MWPTFYIPSRQRPRVVGRLYLTTLLYPVEVSESMKSATAYIGGYQTHTNTDEMTPATAFLSGTLVTRLKSYTDWPPEEMKSSTSFLSGTLVSRLLSQTQPPEEFQSSTAFLSGDIERILVSYANWPVTIEDELIQSSTAFLSGSLT